MDTSLSSDAKKAMKTIMNPDKRKRPTAKEIFELDFFKKRFGIP